MHPKRSAEGEDDLAGASLVRAKLQRSNIARFFPSESPSSAGAPQQPSHDSPAGQSDVASSIRSKLQRPRPPPTPASVLPPEPAAATHPSAPTAARMGVMRPPSSRFLCGGPASGFEARAAISPSAQAVAAPAVSPALEEKDAAARQRGLDAAHASAIFGASRLRAAGELRARRERSVSPPSRSSDDEGTATSHAREGVEPIWKTLRAGDVCIARHHGRKERCTVRGVTHQGYPNARYSVQPDGGGPAFEVEAHEVEREIVQRYTFPWQAAALIPRERAEICATSYIVRGRLLQS
ncbi:hypothetical protein AB1Y20_021683 [Prymnesium parvum]|uniref:Uncharacterized protein n=1 Tax=Prymnesium parvum TaxID=97485 RepID=A0AB34JMB5_PRYPA